MYKVLIIDDEPWSREVVKALVTWDSLTLTLIAEAEDGTEGLKYIRKYKPDIVITDLRMPGIEGVELLKAMYEQFPEIKIIVMSGFDDFVYLKQAIRSRAMEYLLKPIDPEELNKSLEKCIHELEQDVFKSNMSIKTSMIFEDPQVLHKYLSYRQNIFENLLELDKVEILNTFDKMKNFLKSVFAEKMDRNMLSKICHDFVLILEEIMSENEISLDHVWNEKNSDWVVSSGFNSIEEVFADIGWLYSRVIDMITLFRKNKNRLDIKEIQGYIEKHFKEPISLETIAQQFFVSKEHLSRSFKTYTFENISDYILRKRMEKSRELIVEQKLAIKHVSQLVGYDDLAYFYRVFKKHFGIAPGELRNED